MTVSGDADVLALVQNAFEKAGIPAQISMRRFPGETIVVVEVDESSVVPAIEISNALDGQIADGFITVRKAAKQPTATSSKPASLADVRIDMLVELLNSRSRTSEQQPSLRYVRDAGHALSLATSRRHHLIFGRRGVGKTALMLETKRVVETRSAHSIWLNIQTMRRLSASEAFLTTALRICDLPILTFPPGAQPLSLPKAGALRSRIEVMLSTAHLEEHEVSRLIPELQQLINLYCQETAEDLYLFLDELHYLPMALQPAFLDMVHAVTRDTSAWLKVAGIKHQSRWFTDNPPTGLQTGHDAALINLDITLEQPKKAKEFLLSILKSYTEEAGLGSPFVAISHDALDRLVLASGGVPRDFLTLTATAIQIAKQRPKARTAGVQDVNEAAGAIAQVKLQELEDDAASAIGSAKPRTDALKLLRKFLLEDRQITFFRIDFHDKETHPREYELLQSLMDLRMIHLINGGLSDEREAGRRSEVYMLDLSQFSATRFRKNLRVLDLTRGSLILKRTGGSAPARAGDSPKRLLGVLRRGVQFGLSGLSPIVDAESILPA